MIKSEAEARRILADQKNQLEWALRAAHDYLTRHNLPLTKPSD
jgi:hypothetical protein